MESKQDSNHVNEVVILLSDEELEILQRLQQERNMTLSELVHEALCYMDGEPHVC